MNIEVRKSKIEGQIEICPSKSYEQRVLAISALSKQNIKISNNGHSADVKSCSAIAKQIIDSKSNIFNCGESALCARMFPPIIALKSNDFIIEGCGSLLRRNIAKDLKVYEKLFSWRINSDNLPIHISNATLKPGKYYIDGSYTSQIISGLVLALSMLEGNSTIIVENPVSTPYILLTIQIANNAGARITSQVCDKSLAIYIEGNTKYTKETFTIEGDWSNAAFFIAAGITINDIIISGLDMKSAQPDKSIIDVLNLCNAKYTYDDGLLRLQKSDITGFNFDATNCPDLIPPLCLLAINASGKSTIKGVDRLIGKESNRLEAITQELSKIGVTTIHEGNQLSILPCKEPKSATVDTHNDHRIAMMLTIAGLKTQSLIIRNCECVEKSYPNFFDDVIKINAEISKID